MYVLLKHMFQHLLQSLISIRPSDAFTNESEKNWCFMCALRMHQNIDVVFVCGQLVWTVLVQPISLMDLYDQHRCSSYKYYRVYWTLYSKSDQPLSSSNLFWFFAQHAWTFAMQLFQWWICMNNTDVLVMQVRSCILAVRVKCDQHVVSFSLSWWWTRQTEEWKWTGKEDFG